MATTIITSRIFGALHHQEHKMSWLRQNLTVSSDRRMSDREDGSASDSTGDVNWIEIAAVCEKAYRTVAGKRLIAMLDEVPKGLSSNEVSTDTRVIPPRDGTHRPHRSRT